MKNLQKAHTFSFTITLLFAAAFCAMLTISALDSFLLLVKLLIFSLIPFLLVTLMRHLIGAGRPRNTKKVSPSFPSRHTYSAFYIATLFFFFSSVISYILLLFAITLATLRVLLGHHYPRDVVAGAFLGVAAAIISMISF